MLQGIQINDLVQRIVADAKSKKDFIVPATGVTVLDGERMTWGTETMPLNQHAIGQLSTYLGVPTRFVDRLRTDAPDLISVVMNRLLSTKPDDRRMLRTLGGRIRAVMSDQYRRLDHEDVAERTLPLIEEAGYEIRSANVTESKLYIHVVSPRSEGEIRVGDPVRFGWMISNSEVGQGSLSMQLFIEYLRCTNGMTIPEFSKKRAHIGGRAEASETFLVKASSETLKASDDALWLGVRDHIREFSSPAGIKRVMDRLKEHTEAPVTGDPTAVIEALGNKFLLNQDEKKSVLYSYLETGDKTRWGLANAVTFLANSEGDYDRAVDLERIGGEVLMTNASEWKAIGQAVA